MIRPTNCPVCRKAVPKTEGKPAVTFPFCSERCRNIDLARWADGKYAIVEQLNPIQLAMELESDQEQE